MKRTNLVINSEKSFDILKGKTLNHNGNTKIHEVHDFH